MSLALFQPRALQPVTLDEAKLFARVDGSIDDELINSMVIAATDDCEALLHRSILPQQWKLTLDTFQCASGPLSTQWPVPINAQAPGYNGPIVLQRPTVTAIISINYNQATDGALTVLPPSEYQLAASSDYTARVVPAYGKSWPGIRSQPEAVQIIFTSGYVDVASVPENIKLWIKMRIKDIYDNRGAWTLGKNVEVNRYVDFMLDRYLAMSF